MGLGTSGMLVGGWCNTFDLRYSDRFSRDRDHAEDKYSHSDNIHNSGSSNNSGKKQIY